VFVYLVQKNKNEPTDKQIVQYSYTQ